MQIFFDELAERVEQLDLYGVSDLVYRDVKYYIDTGYTGRGARVQSKPIDSKSVSVSVDAGIGAWLKRPLVMCEVLKIDLTSQGIGTREARRIAREHSDIYAMRRFTGEEYKSYARCMKKLGRRA